MVIMAVVLIGLLVGGLFLFKNKTLAPVKNKFEPDSRLTSYKSLSGKKKQLFHKDTQSIVYLGQMRLALLLYYDDNNKLPQSINDLIPKYLPSTAEQQGAYNSDQFHYFRCSPKDFHIGVSLTFNHDPIDLGQDNKSRVLATDLDKKVCNDDPIKFRDDSKCFSTDIGNYCYDLGREGSETKTKEIKDWQTYRNEKYGFEIRHPLNWGNPIISAGREFGISEGKSYQSGESIVYSNYGYDAEIGFSNGNGITMIIVNIDSTDKRVYATSCLESYRIEGTSCDYQDYTLAEDAQRIKNLPDGILSKWASGDIEELKTLSNNGLRVVSFPANTINDNDGRTYKFYGKDFAYQVYFPPATSKMEAELFLSTFTITN